MAINQWIEVMDEKKKQLLERDAKIRSLQAELDQLTIKIRGHSEDSDGKVNRLERLVKELTDENAQLKALAEGHKKEVEEAKTPLKELV